MVFASVSSFGVAACRRHDGQRVAAVGEQLRLAALEVGDRRAVGAPRRPRVVVGPGPRRQRARLGAGLGVDDEDVGVVGAIGVAAPAADERDLRPVRRPRRQRIVPVARGQRLDGARRDVQEVEVRAPVDQVALAIALEAVAVDDDRLLRRLVLAGLVFLGIGVVADEDQPRRIGGPPDVAGAALAGGEPPRLAALAAEEPDLPARRLVVVTALPAGHERDPLAVGAEARLRFAGRAGRQADVLGAGPVRQPDVAFVLVRARSGSPTV